MNLQNYYAVYRNDLNEAMNKIIVTNGKNIGIEINKALEQWVTQSEEIRKKNGTFFFCGNGASATIAEHLSHDCFQNADFMTYTCSETSHITAISNDISYEDVFAYRIGKMLCGNDMLITISSSGNSSNIIKAIQTAKEKDVFVVTLSGKDSDNRSRKLGNLNFYVPLATYGMVESAHAMLMHIWLDMYLDQYKGGRH